MTPNDDSSPRSSGQPPEDRSEPREAISTRTIRVENLTRVEGEGGLDIRLRNGQLDDVHLHIFEPPRFFEAMLRGRPLEEAPDITARICGICPVAYQMSSVHAIESALGITPGESIRRLRRLLYCAEWIESHALHVHLLHAPDFLGYPGSLEMARDYPELVTRGLQIRKVGNRLLEILGGRAVHPINVAVGGFYQSPRRESLTELIADLETALQLAIDATRWVAEFDFPEFDSPYDTVCLFHPEEYPLCEGRIETSDGVSITSDDFETLFVERQVAHSTAMQAVRSDTGETYLLGPLARINRCREQLLPTARRLADEIGWETPCGNPYRMIIARSLEIVHAIEESLQIIQQYQPPKPSRVTFQPRAGSGSAATEAPRGLLYHRYSVNEVGEIEHANIIPPTSQNQGQIERDLRALLPDILDEQDAVVAERCEKLVRCYDPCISCSTHFLKVNLHRV
jgi:sulfhydrogenase subunit alpha